MVSSTGEDADIEGMQQSFQEFMLGTPRSMKSNPSTITSTPSSNLSQARTPSSVASAQRKKMLRQCDQKLHSFVELFRGEWLETDTTLLQLVQSLAHLRERCYKESLMITQEFDNIAISKEERYSKGNYLSKEDVELALSNDLRKHEHTLSNIRKLMMSLQLTQEALGRRLDDILAFQNTNWAFMEEIRAERRYEDLLQRLLFCELLYPVLADELYRKQRFVEELLESSNDTLLLPGNGISDKDGSVGTARRISLRWSRAHKDSHLASCGEIINGLFQKED